MNEAVRKFMSENGRKGASNRWKKVDKQARSEYARKMGLIMHKKYGHKLSDDVS